MSMAMTATRAGVGLAFRTAKRVRGVGSIDQLDPQRREAVPTRTQQSRMSIERFELAGRSVLAVSPRLAPKPIDVVFWHGGAYVRPLTLQHWWIIDRIVQGTGATVFVPSYGLAPEHTFDESLPLMDALARHAGERADAKGRRLVVVGDSAGGGLALSQAIRTRDSGGRPADRIVLLSPWLDVTLADPRSRVLSALDAVHDRDDLVAAGRRWAGERNPVDPLVSPLYDHGRGLPPLTIHQSGHDLLAPDGSTFTDKVLAAGGEVDLRVEPEAFHDYLLVPVTPEARSTLAAVVDAVRG